MMELKSVRPGILGMLEYVFAPATGLATSGAPVSRTANVNAPTSLITDLNL